MVDPRRPISEDQPKSARHIAEGVRPALVIFDDLDGAHPRIVIVARQLSADYGSGVPSPYRLRMRSFTSSGDMSFWAAPTVTA